MQSLIISLVLVLLLTGPALAAKKPKAPFGLRIGMSEEAVRERLRKIGEQQKEEREEEEGGEQEVWILKNDRKFDYLLVRFDRQHRLSFATVVVRKDARMAYSDVADLSNARHATDGRNHSYTWTVVASGKEPGFRMIARGADPKFLTSYSIYRLSEEIR